MKVKELADLARTTVRTVRYYHQVNLLPLPESRHGWRNYGMAHVARLMRVRWLVDVGVPLAHIRELLALEQRSPDAPESPAGPDGGALPGEDMAPPSVGETRSDDAARSETMADLRAVLNAIDQQLEDLTAKRGHLSALLDTVEGGGPLTPVPASLARMYQELARRAPTARSRRLIQGEWDLMELACYRGDLPEDVVDFAERLTEEDLDRLVEFIDTFQRIADTRPVDAEQQLREQARAVVAFTERIAPDLLSRWVGMFAGGRYAWAWKAFALVFPSHYFRLYAEAIAEAFGVELSSADRRALAAWGREAGGAIRTPPDTTPSGTTPPGTAGPDRTATGVS